MTETKINGPHVLHTLCLAYSVFKQWKERYFVLTMEGSLLVCCDAESPPDQVVALRTNSETIVEGREILQRVLRFLPKLPAGGRRNCCFALILPQNKFLLLLSDNPDHKHTHTQEPSCICPTHYQIFMVSSSHMFTADGYQTGAIMCFPCVVMKFYKLSGQIEWLIISLSQSVVQESEGGELAVFTFVCSLCCFNQSCPQVFIASFKIKILKCDICKHLNRFALDVFNLWLIPINSFPVSSNNLVVASFSTVSSLLWASTDGAASLPASPTKTPCPTPPGHPGLLRELLFCLQQTCPKSSPVRGQILQQLPS